MSSKKGGIYEREICGELSTWWSGGEADDLFWRTAGSGGRATVRGKKGKSTTGHCGDVSATDKRGAKLLKVIAIEIKRGYNKDTFANLLDKPKHAAEQVWETWIKQAIASRDAAKAKFWMIIQRRDRKEAICFFPHAMLVAIAGPDSLNPLPRPFVHLDVKVVGIGNIEVVGMKLKSFFKGVEPIQIKKYLRSLS